VALHHPELQGLAQPDDAALGVALGAGVVERRTVHAWPLSWVQRVTLADGRRFAVKAQRPPTVEPAFYAAARSPLLAPHVALPDVEGCAVLAVEWIDAPALETLDGDAFLDHARRATETIARIAGDVPARADLGSADGWRAAAAWTLERLEPLSADGRLPSVGPDAVARVRAWLTADATAQRADALGRVVVHGDLAADQVFVTADGHRVVDWQRPVLGPPGLDLASVLIRAHRDPAGHADPHAIAAFWLLLLMWSVEAQHDLWPRHPLGLFDQWAAMAVARLPGGG
jgi:Ser/Thr protein kinase RdoA (MazF antagonist)